MQGNSRTIHLVDDDEAIRRSASLVLRTSGYLVRTYELGTHLLEAEALAPGCILMDVRMPEMDGLEVQAALKERGVTLPVIVMTGHGDVNLAVRAMKAGAIDFIEKPFEKADLIAAIEEGFERIEKADRRQAQKEEALARLAVLTPREIEVLKGLVEGLPNKTIAYHLGISPRTVEVHRANLMAKLSVPSLSDALKLAFAAGMAGEQVMAS
jgi:two-component system, LuxR family, response regulator FixJ